MSRRSVDLVFVSGMTSSQLYDTGIECIRLKNINFKLMNTINSIVTFSRVQSRYHILSNLLIDFQ